LAGFHAHVTVHVVDLAKLVGYLGNDTCNSTAGLAHNSDDRCDLGHDVAELFDCLHSEDDTFEGQFTTERKMSHFPNLSTLVGVESRVRGILGELSADASLKHLLVALLEPGGHVLQFFFL